MSQIPASPIEDIRTRMMEGERKRLQDIINAQTTIKTPFESLYYNEDYDPTFLTPENNFFGSLADRWLVGGEELRSVDAGMLQSFAEMGFSGGHVDLPAPYINRNEDIFIGGISRPAADVSLDEIWAALPPAHRGILEQRGKTLDFVKGLQITNGEEFAEWFQLNMKITQAQEALHAYSEESPILSGVSFVSSMIGNAADPVLLISLAAAPFTGGTSLGAIGAKETTKAAAKEATKATLRETITRGAATFIRGTLDPSTLALRSALESGGKRAITTRALLTAAGATQGAAYGVLGNAGQNDVMNTLGEQDPEFELGVGPGLLGGTVGGVFTYWAVRGVFNKVNRTGTDLMAASEEAAATLATVRHVAREERLGRLDGPDAADIAASEAIESILGSIYPSKAVQDITAYIFRDGKTIDDLDVRRFAELLSQAPTVAEIEDFLTRPNLTNGKPATLRKTQYARIMTRINKYAEQLQAPGGLSPQKLKNVTDNYRRAANELQAHVKANFRMDGELEGIADQLRRYIKDSPVSALPDDEAVGRALAEILVKNRKAIQDDYKGRSLVSNLHRFGSSKYGKYLGGNLFTGDKMRARAAISSDNFDAQVVGLIHGLIDNKGFHNSELLKNSKGVAVRSVQKRQQTDEIQYLYPIVRSLKLLKKANPQLTEREIFVKVARAISEGADIEESFAPLVNAYSRYIKEVGDRGISSNTFGRRLDNYFNFTVAHSYDRVKAESAVRASYKKVYGKLYNLSDDGSAVNYTALHRAGYLDKDFNILENPSTGLPYFDEMPKELGDIQDAAIRADYEKKLPESLDQDSLTFFERRSGGRNRSDAEVLEERIPAASTRYTDRAKVRVADQSIYLDDAVIESGFINTNLHESARAYHRGTGYHVNRDAAVSELFGDRVTWGQLEKMLDNLVTSSEAKDLVKGLKRLDAVTSGTFRTGPEGAQIAAVVNNTAASMIAGKLGISIIPLEISGSYLRHIMQDAHLIENISMLVDGFRKTFNKEELRLMGILHESDMFENRFLANLDEQTPDAASRSKLVDGTRMGSHAVRVALGERILTSHARSVSYGTTFAKLHKIRRKLELLSKMPKGNLTDSEFKGFARSVGIDHAELKMLQNYGLLEPRMVKAARKIRDLDPQGLRGDNRMLSIAREQGDPDMLELWRRLNEMAREDAETFVLRPTRGDVPTTDNAAANFLFSMTSFVNGFYTSTLTRVGNTPYSKQLAFFSFMLGAQIFTNVTRDILYRGESPDTVLEKWREDPTKELALAVSMLPMQGQFGLLPHTAFAYGVDASPGRALDQVFTGTTPGMFAKGAESLYRAANKSLKGEELSESDIRGLENSMPGYNSFILRLIEEVQEGFQADSDK